MAIFDALLDLVQVLDTVILFPNWRSLVPTVLGVAGGIAIYSYDLCSPNSAIAASVATLSGVMIGSVWEYRWRISQRGQLNAS